MHDHTLYFFVRYLSWMQILQTSFTHGLHTNRRRSTTCHTDDTDYWNMTLTVDSTT